MSRRVLRAQVITTKMFKSISNFVRENRYQDNVQNNVRVCTLTPSVRYQSTRPAK